MAKVISYEVELKGLRKSVKNQGDLIKSIRETREELKGVDKGSKAYDRLERKLAGLKSLQVETREEAKKQGLEFKIAADKGRKSWKGLTAQLKLAELQYKELTQAEREAAKGQQLANKIKGIREEVKELNEGIGKRGLSGALQDAFSQVGGLDITALTSVAGAATAAVGAVVEVGQFVNQTVQEFKQLRGEIQNLTGETGPPLDEFTARVAAISETFNQSQEEILASANAVSKQFGIPFEEALAGIEEGFIAGSDQTDEFLNTLKEYPTFFKEAEISASQFFAIANKQATEGVYSDKGVDAIKEATIRLRELPTAAIEGLAAVNLQAGDIRKTIEEEGIGAAIADVSEAIGQFEADAPEVGQAIAGIFGGPGEDVGVNFITALQTINDETESLIDTTNEYQVEQQKTLALNQDFARLQNELTLQLGDSAFSFRTLALEIRNGALQVLIFIIERFKVLFSALRPVGEALGRLAQAFGIIDETGKKTAGTIKFLQTVVHAIDQSWKTFTESLSFFIDKLAGAVTGVKGFLRSIGFFKKETADTADQVDQVGQSTEELAKTQKTADKQTKKSTKTAAQYRQELDDLKKSTREAAIATDQFAKGSIAQLSKEVQGLQAQLDQAAPEDQASILLKLVDAEKALADAKKLRQDLRQRLILDEEEIQVEIDFNIEAENIEEAGPLSGILEDIEEAKLRSIAAARDISQTDEEFIRRRSDLQLQAEIETTKARLAIEELTGNERLKLEESLADQSLELTQNRLDRELELEKEKADQLSEIRSGIFEGIDQVNALLSQSSQARTDAEIRSLEAKYDKEIEMAEGNEQRQEELREELADKRSELERQEFEEQKKYRVASALSALASGIINILSAPSTIPDPFGSVFKAFRIGILSATTAAQIAAINRAEAAKGDFVEVLGSGNVIDGQVRGSTHSKGSGVPISIYGRRFLVEHGETIQQDETGGVAIINKRSSATFNRQLRRSRGLSWPGKRAWLSSINNHKNWGVAYAAEGAFTPNEAALSASITPTGPGGRAGVVVLSEDSIQILATQNGQAVYLGTKQGVEVGLFDANRRLEREARLEDRTGVNR